MVYPTLLAAVGDVAHPAWRARSVGVATERMRTPGPGGTIVHAEIEIGDSIVMIADEDPNQDLTKSLHAEHDARRWRQPSRSQQHVPD